MRDKGYYGIGIENGKTEANYWTLFRTAQILDADFLFTIGERFKRHPADSLKCFKHMPVFSFRDFADFNEHRPFNCRLVGIEITETAVNLEDYQHPKQACYLLGAEDNGLSKEALANCQDIIRLYGDRSFNVSVAGSIVIYDRHVKQMRALR